MKTVKRNIYLDIDGVILTRGVVPALHLDRFLQHTLNNYSVFWLTLKYRGDPKKIIRYLSQFVIPHTTLLLKHIKPTYFDLDKTEAIDFSKNFFLLDDDLFDSEIKTLKEHNALDCWIKLDLMKNPDQLLNLVNSRLGLQKHE